MSSLDREYFKETSHPSRLQPVSRQERYYSKFLPLQLKKKKKDKKSLNIAIKKEENHNKIGFL